MEDYKGIFARCSPYGAIFIDEIGEVGEPIQIKRLQVLQDRRFTPVGSHEAQHFSGRIIAATNRPLELIRKEQILRDDFYYRLCSDVIEIPSLARRIREDPAELDDLLDHTANRILGKPSPELTGMLRDTVRSQLGDHYEWPGNVRELEQCVRRVLLNRTYTPWMPPQPSDPIAGLTREISEGRIDAQHLLAAYCYCLYQRLGTYEAVAQRVNLDRRTVKKAYRVGQGAF